MADPVTGAVGAGAIGAGFLGGGGGSLDAGSAVGDTTLGAVTGPTINVGGGFTNKQTTIGLAIVGILGLVYILKRGR